MMVSTRISEKRDVAIERLRPGLDRQATRILYFLAGEADALEKRAAGAEASILETTKIRRERPLKSDEQYVLCQAKIRKAEAQLAAEIFEEALGAAQGVLDYEA